MNDEKLNTLVMYTIEADMSANDFRALADVIHHVVFLIDKDAHFVGRTNRGLDHEEDRESFVKYVDTKVSDIMNEISGWEKEETK